MDDLISRHAAIDAAHGRIFHEIVVEYPSINTYPEYKGKPYFSIKYTENGKEFIGYGTYKPEVLSEYLKEYFMPSAQQWIPCDERLPEPAAPSQRREWFITSNQYGGVTQTCYEFEASPFKMGWQTDMTILAWMPLPKPYEAERKEE